MKRKDLDFWLLAGMIGLWVWWFFLSGLKVHVVKSYLWLMWRNKFPICWVGASVLLVTFCIRKRRWGIGAAILVATVVLGYWAYGPDFPRSSQKPKVLWHRLNHGVPVFVFITYEWEEYLPPVPWARFIGQIYRRPIYLNEREWKGLSKQAKEALVMLVQKAGEDTRLFQRCLSIALNFVQKHKLQEVAPPLVLCAEKRYERVTKQLCWVFAFLEPQKVGDEKPGLLRLIGLFANVDWVAVRLRFPQKAWLTYLTDEPEEVFRSLLSTLLVIAGYVGILIGFRWAFNKWGLV